jgi:predicted membrane protein
MEPSAVEVLSLGRARAWRGRDRILAIGFTILVLLPCFWQRRIQAGDLSSHLYNAWLAIETREGRAPGLELTRQWTNILFDLLLEGLLRAAGAEAAQRIAASVLVVVFFWGVMAFLRATSGGWAWWLAPLVWALAYGWVFHIGLCNFLLSLGLCCWALALARHPGAGRRVAAGVLGVLAVSAHALPVAWAAGLVVYQLLARRLGTAGRLALFAVSAAALWALRQVALARFGGVDRPSLVVLGAGADQLWVYGDRFRLLASAAAGLCAALLVLYLVQHGLHRLGRDDLLAWYLLTVLAVELVPFGVWLPGYRQALTLLPERISLFAGVALCAVLAHYRAGPVERTALWALALSFFSLLYLDHRALNAVEDRFEAALAQVPVGARVISALCLSRSRIDALEHMVDRACLGRCYSYGNYEPQSWAFRVQTRGPNRFAVADVDTMIRMRAGEYVVQAWEAPIYEIYACQEGREVCVRRLEAGDQTSSTCLEAMPPMQARRKGDS